MTETDRRMMSGALQATALLAQREGDAAARARRREPRDKGSAPLPPRPTPTRGERADHARGICDENRCKLCLRCVDCNGESKVGFGDGETCLRCKGAGVASPPQPGEAPAWTDAPCNRGLAGCVVTHTEPAGQETHRFAQPGEGSEPPASYVRPTKPPTCETCRETLLNGTECGDCGATFDASNWRPRPSTPGTAAPTQVLSKTENTQSARFTLKLTCCGREDEPPREPMTWDEADRFRECYLSGVGVVSAERPHDGGHVRSAIIIQAGTGRSPGASNPPESPDGSSASNPTPEPIKPPTP
jgi:hypothetical protein